MLDRRPSPELLRKLLRYETETGKLFWRKRTVDMFRSGRQPAENIFAAWTSRWAGREAFISATGDGYKRGKIGAKPHKAHRVIWAIVHGAWPECEIDHINGDRSDNRIVNLRSVTRQENAKNQKVRSDNMSGVLGVSWNKRDKRWQPYIKANGKNKNLGSFRSKADAIAARKAAEKEHGYHENHGRK